MKNNHRKLAAKEGDFLVNVAHSIGSTLGAVAAKVSGSPRAPRRRGAGRRTVRKQRSASLSSPRTSGRTSTRGNRIAVRRVKSRRKTSR